MGAQATEGPQSLIPDGAELSAPVSNGPDSISSPAASKGAGEAAVVPVLKGKTFQHSKSGKGNKKKRKMRVKLPGVGELTWGEIWKLVKDFLANPINFAAFLWCLLASAAFVVIVLIKVGLLNSTIPDAHTREEVDETATQILNALFTLMCLVWHPALCRNVLLLIRWRPADKVELRHEFCKNGKRKPHDRFHMSMVVFWAQVTCWATYAFAAVFWVYPVGQRPTWLFVSTTIISFAAPAIALLWQLLSPLSKDFDVVKEGDDSSAPVFKMYQRSPAFFVGHNEVHQAVWNGTIFPGCCSDTRVACITFLCPCWMFGYNMERLGFGHRVIHALVICIVLLGPLLLFEFSAAIIEKEHARDIVYRTGALVALLGLGYGGLWRIKMRETYKLPGSRVCCGSKRLTDVCAWMWCSYCALCQEVRTTDQYQVGDSCSYHQAVDIEAGEGAGGVPAAVVNVEEGDEFDEGDDSGSDEEESPRTVEMVNGAAPKDVPPVATMAS